MLTSWPNFFFVAFEPGGSVSVDKPPLGLWIEAISAGLMGINGFALAFPNALAGTLAIGLLFYMVKKQFGLAAGATAALVLAVTPITIATERNNTMDGMLVFVLLLAAWAIWRAVENGRASALLLGMLIMGAAFNIKMLQAYMILPALYALYFFGTGYLRWQKRVLHLCAAVGLMLAVSLSWALIVDAVPVDSRPFIGSSTDNSVMELIVGHNGIKRLIGTDSTQTESTSTTVDISTGNPNEVGAAGALRLFTEPLAPQVSWLLPMALMGLGLAWVMAGKPNRLNDRHLALILWGGWLLPMGLYFSFTTGLWHTYYLIMMGPALAAQVGSAVWAFDQVWKKSPMLCAGVVLLASGATLGFEIVSLTGYPDIFDTAIVPMTMGWLAGMAALGLLRQRTWALALILASLLVPPFLWSEMTAFNPHPEVNLPSAGPLRGQPDITLLNETQVKVMDYLLSRTNSDAYLAATLDSHGASPLILATGRAVLTFGGYVGRDDILTPTGLREWVSSGRLRYVIDDGNLWEKPTINSWVTANCSVVQIPGVNVSARAGNKSTGGPRDQQFTALYDCAALAN